MSSKLVKIFDKIALNNKTSHAFILANTKYEDIKDDLTKILSKNFYKSKINIEENPDIYLINPINSVITKDQILDLLTKIKLTSQFELIKTYVISECDKMNAYAANSLLKTLEEPEKNILAFLICENIEQVLPTIKSRCQIIYLNKESNTNIEKEPEILKNTFKFIKIIEKQKTKSFAYHNINYKKLTKDYLKKMLNIVKYFYRDVLNLKLSIKLEYFEEEDFINEISKINTISSINKKILIVNDLIQNIDLNINLYLTLDKLIIEFGKCETKDE